MPLLHERSNFVGNQVPLEVKVLIKQLKRCNVDVFQQLVKAAGVMLSVDNPSHETFQNLTSGIDSAWIEKLYPGIITIISRALRLPTIKLKKDDLIHDLKEINMPESFFDPLIQVLFGETREAMDDSALMRRPRFPSVDNFRWRVDVGISTTSLKRVLEPSVLCNIKTSDNQDCTFEVTKEKFHELRYAVAEVLNHMQQLEKRSILNIET